MMKYECDIVKDLMPLYIDELLSEIKIPVSKEARFSDLRPIEYLKSNLSKKIIKKVLGTTLVIGLLVGAFLFAQLYKLPVEPQMIDFYVNDNYLMMKYQEKGDILFSAGNSW